MFRFIKKIVISILMTFSSRNFLQNSGNIIKNITGNFMLIQKDKPNCFLLKNQEYKVRKVIFDNDYMTSL